MFICNGQKDCQQGEDEFCSGIISNIGNKSLYISTNETFKCLISGNVVSVFSVGDCLSECSTFSEDESQYYNLLTNSYQSGVPCTNSNEFPCVAGHTYCFPVSKLCVYDFDHRFLQLRYCRNGAHLHNCTHFQCLEYFKCSLSYCIPFDLVCNGNWDCPRGHDEHSSFEYSCSQTNNPTFSSLRKIDMSFSKLTIVKSFCLKSIESLKMLYLQVNKIRSAEDNSFGDLQNLKILDLSYNKIAKLPKGIFIGLNTVADINLTVNLITGINVDTFSSIPHYTVHSLKKQVYCMSGSWSKCKVKTEKLSNCNDLLSNKGLGKMFWFTSVFIILMNSICIVIHFKLFSQLPITKFFTLGLSLVDYLYGMYLLLISSVNLYYEEYDARVEYAWKQNFVCKASAFTTLVSFIGSPTISFVMLMARFCVIQWPMTSKFKSKMFIRRIIFAVLLLIINCCFIVGISFVYRFGSHIPTGLCLLLYTTGQQPEFI